MDAKLYSMASRGRGDVDLLPTSSSSTTFYTKQNLTRIATFLFTTWMPKIFSCFAPFALSLLASSVRFQHPFRVESKMPTLADLPQELVDNILLSVPRSDRAKLARTCRWLNATTIPTLYKENKEENCWAVWTCVLENYMEALEFGLKMGLDPNASRLELGYRRPNLPDEESYHTYPLHLAAKDGNNKAIKLLLDAGADLEATTSFYCNCTILQTSTEHRPPWTALHLAICCGHVSTAEMLINRGASMTVARVSARPTCVGPVPCIPMLGSNTTALHTASKEGMIDMVNLILDRGLVSPDNRDIYSRTPLHYAVQMGPRGLAVARLLEAGADQTLKDSNWRTPLEVACMIGNYEAALMLLNSSHSRVRLNHRSINRIFRFAIMHFQFLDIPQGRGEGCHIFQHPPARDHRRKLKVVRALLGMGGVEINQRSVNTGITGITGGLTPLHLALLTTFAGHGVELPDTVQLVRLLLEAGARPNSLTPGGRSSLHLIIDHAMGWTTNSDGSTARSARQELAAFVTLLISYGARLDVRGSSRNAPSSPIVYAIEKVGTSSTAHFLINAMMRAAAEQGHLGRMKPKPDSQPKPDGAENEKGISNKEAEYLDPEGTSSKRKAEDDDVQGYQPVEKRRKSQEPGQQ